MIKKLLLSMALLPSLVLADAKPLDFAIIGDYGANVQGEGKIAHLIHKASPQFIITLGDNNYRSGCWETIDANIGQYYSNFIGHYKGRYGKGATNNRFFPSLGNHDWYAAEKCLHHGNLPYLEYFTLPGNGRYYEFVKGPVHFFALDSDKHEPDGVTITSAQHKWFKAAIAKSKAPFKIVYFHHAPYSSSSHGNDERMQWDFKALGVDLVLAGHDHTYERIIRDDLTYIVNGIGGPEQLDKKRHDTPGSVIFYSGKYGYMRAYGDEKTLNFELINENGKVKDRFSIRHNNTDFVKKLSIKA